MRSWPQPSYPQFPTSVVPYSPSGNGEQFPPLELYDTADDRIKPVQIPTDGSPVGLYVCGITPYDSTHLGHAATYVTFDVINRYLRAAGHDVNYVQNVTDVDDPLFERAERDGVDWRELGEQQTELFRSDMTDLAVLPPEHYVGAMETVDEVIDLVERLLSHGAAYQLSGEYGDIYADHSKTAAFGYVSRFDEDTMMELFAERGGDPERKDKRHPLDALLWRAHRHGEPKWDSPFGAGRPGWHVECAAIAANRLGSEFSIQGGGEDLRYPHHEYSAAHVEAGCGSSRMANHYVHTGMIGLDGTKMSKSLGNLEFVSRLTARGVDPSAIRVGIYSQHYRSDRDWSESLLAEATQRLASWRVAVAFENDASRAGHALQNIQFSLAQDLDTPAALSALDHWALEVTKNVANDEVSTAGSARSDAGQAMSDGVSALLGVTL